jgi:hypothetical protein
MGRMTEMFEAQKDREPIYTVAEWQANRRRYLRKRWIFWTTVLALIIAAAAFYGLDQIKAIWRDVGDIISGWGK